MRNSKWKVGFVDNGGVKRLLPHPFHDQFRGAAGLSCLSFPCRYVSPSWLFHRSLSTVSDTRRYRLVRVHQGSPPLPTIAGIRRQLDTRFAIVLRISISISHEPFIIGSVSKNLMVLPTVLRRYRERAMHCVEDDFDRCD